MNRLVRSLIIVVVLITMLFPTIDSRADTTHCGTISSDEIWDSSGNVHIVTCDVIVNTGVTLTISAGAIVKFHTGTTLIVDGALKVLGTSVNKIYFTSIRDDAVGGDTNGDGGATVPGVANWKTIRFRDSSDDANSLIDHAVIRYTGWDYLGNITLNSASPTVQNSTLSDGHISLRADVTSFPSLVGNEYEDNNYNAFGLDGGTIGADSTWDITDVSYMIIDTIFVGVGSQLTIQPGVVVKFSDARELIVDGILKVLGTASESVYFTSIHDDAIGGDTNGNGGATTPGWANWKTIRFRDNSDDANSLIDHAVIRYTGWDYLGNITLNSASPTIRNTVLTLGAYGMRVESSHPSLVCNTIADNSQGGMYNDTVGDVINARNQWWGAASGPYHETANPAGLGNKVSDGVLFSPWLTAPCGTPVTDMTKVYLPLAIR